MIYVALVAPNGMFVEIGDAYPASFNEERIVDLAGLSCRLRDVSLEIALNCDDAQPFYAAYGDCGFHDNAAILVPYPKTRSMDPIQKRFNQSMASARVSIENAFAKVVNLWAFVDFDKNLHLNAQPIGSYYVVAILLTNAHSCIYGNQVARAFGVPTPSLEMYFE